MRRRYVYCEESKGLVEVPWDRRSEPLAPLVMFDLPAYVSPVSGKLIDGRRARREDLKRTGSRPYEGRASETAHIKRQEQYAAAKAEASLDRAAHRAWAEAPERVRRELRHR